VAAADTFGLARMRTDLDVFARNLAAYTPDNLPGVREAARRAMEAVAAIAEASQTATEAMASLRTELQIADRRNFEFESMRQTLQRLAACSECGVKLEPNEVATVAPCGHLLHLRCLHRRSGVCSLCSH
jgi:hypothetical protein